MKCFGFLFVLLSVLACRAPASPLEQILKDALLTVSNVIDDADKYEVQIRYTQIDRDSLNRPTFRWYEFGVDEDRYFYPASTVKMPVAALAIEYINELRDQLQDDRIHIDAPIFIDSLRYKQSAVDGIDTTSSTGHASVAHYVKKIFAVSDNDAYNRLFEILGRANINRKLKEKGFSHTDILHRLSLFGIDNRYTPSWQMAAADTIILLQPEKIDSVHPPHTIDGLIKGRAYINPDGALVNEPFDFSEKNRFSIRDMEDVLRSILFPESVAEDRRFRLTPSDYQRLYQWMSILPRESRHPRYDYVDSWVKFILYGDSEETIPDHIRIFNKVGIAYGYLTDCAYVVDFDNRVEFLLTATISVNANQIYNDGIYEYDETGFPFIAELGKAVYAYELKRERDYKPDLKKFKVLH